MVDSESSGFVGFHSISQMSSASAAVWRFVSLNCFCHIKHSPSCPVRAWQLLTSFLSPLSLSMQTMHSFLPAAAPMVGVSKPANGSVPEALTAGLSSEPSRGVMRPPAATPLPAWGSLMERAVWRSVPELDLAFWMYILRDCSCPFSAGVHKRGRGYERKGPRASEESARGSARTVRFMRALL